MHGQGNNGLTQPLIQYFSARFDAAHFRHSNIRYHNIGPEILGGPDQSDAILRGTDHVKPGVQQIANLLQNVGMIIRDQQTRSAFGTFDAREFLRTPPHFPGTRPGVLTLPY